MAIYDAALRRGGLRLVPSRSEAGAVNMADGYARASGGLGVVLTSTGTGAGNACGALTEAQTAGTPLLHLTGQVESPSLEKGRGFIHEAKDQLGLLRAVSKAAHRPIGPAAVPWTVHAAVGEALAAPRGVVSIELPVDCQYAPLDAPLPRPVAPPRLAPVP